MHEHTLYNWKFKWVLLKKFVTVLHQTYFHNYFYLIFWLKKKDGKKRNLLKWDRIGKTRVTIEICTNIKLNLLIPNRKRLKIIYFHAKIVIRNAIKILQMNFFFKILINSFLTINSSTFSTFSFLICFFLNKKKNLYFSLHHTHFIWHWSLLSLLMFLREH